MLVNPIFGSVIFDLNPMTLFEYDLDILKYLHTKN